MTSSIFANNLQETQLSLSTAHQRHITLQVK